MTLPTSGAFFTQKIPENKYAKTKALHCHRAHMACCVSVPSQTAIPVNQIPYFQKGNFQQRSNSFSKNRFLHLFYQRLSSRRNLPDIPYDNTRRSRAEKPPPHRQIEPFGYFPFIDERKYRSPLRFRQKQGCFAFFYTSCIHSVFLLTPCF